MQGNGSIRCACEVCGKEFWAFRSRRAEGKDRTCSVLCGVIRRRRPHKTTAEVFWAGVPDRPAEGCWPWKGPHGPNGYSYMRVPELGRPMRAHRIAWEVASGAPVPDGANVLHTCDVRDCVRNDELGTYEVSGMLFPRRGHLFLGTQAINNLDRNLKGRQALGEQSGAAVLTEAQIPVIRARRAAGESGPQLAAAFGVSAHTIYGIAKRKMWRHVP